MNDPTTTTVSEPTRPVSALEQTLWKYASWNSQNYEQERTGNADERRGRQDAFRQSAIVVHARDAQLWAKIKEWEAKAQDQAWGENAIPPDANPYTLCVNALRAILEGKTS